MSLVLGIRCGDSAVLFADSQESYGEYKISVNKLVPRTLKACDIAFAGAGNQASLIDGLERVIVEDLSGHEAVTDSQIPQIVRDAVVKFHGSGEFRNYPATDEEKHITGTLCVRAPNAGVFLLHIRATSVMPIDSFRLMGWDEPLYTATAQRLYSPNMSVQQAIVLGLHVFDLAKQTTTTVGGPTRIIVATPSSLTQEPAVAVADLEARIHRFTTAIDRLLLRAPDTSMPIPQFRSECFRLEQTLLELRRENLEAATLRMAGQGYAGPRWPLPQGVIVPANPLGRMRAATEPVAPHYPNLALAQDVYHAASRFLDYVNAAYSNGELNPGLHAYYVWWTANLIGHAHKMLVLVEQAASNPDRREAYLRANAKEFWDAAKESEQIIGNLRNESSSLPHPASFPQALTELHDALVRGLAAFTGVFMQIGDLTPLPPDTEPRPGG